MQTKRVAMGTGMFLAGMATKRTVWAQETETHKELPIYDVPEEQPKYEIEEVPDTILKTPIAFFRSSLSKTANFFKESKQTAVEYATKVDNATKDFREGNVKFLPKGEELLPGSAYVLISALTGSLFVKKSNFIVRGLTPIVFGMVAFKYVYPSSAAHIMSSWGVPTITPDEIKASISDLAQRRYEVIRNSILGEQKNPQESEKENH